MVEHADPGEAVHERLSVQQRGRERANLGLKLS
jgi:hypothetical protein